MRRGALRLGASCSTPAVTDANGDQFTFGDPGAGDFYKAVELGVKIALLTEKAGFSKVLLWHTDGIKDGQPINANTVESGWVSPS